MLWKKIQTNVPIISFVLLTILVSYYAGSKQLIQWISPLQREPSSYIMPEGKQQLLAGEKMDLKNFEYFAKTLDCRDKNSYQNQSYKSEALEFLSNKQIISRCSDCSGYFDTINSNGFAPSTQVEVETPLAFAFTVHKEIGILEVFLSLNFRPTDAYCIHVDAKADTEIFKTVSSLVHCYNEVFPDSLVFLPRQAIPVFWGSGGSTMEADFICYRELMARSNKWKYVGNVAGTELPFVSIQRFRQKLKEANGYSFTIGKNSFADRMKHFWELER